MRKAVSPVVKREDIENTFAIFAPRNIYYIDNLEEVLNLGSSRYCTGINSKVESAMVNINNILDNGKDGVKVIGKRQRCQKDGF